MEFLRKLGNLSLALLVLLSTVSWTVEEHYCMGRLIEVSFFTEAHGCGMEMDDTDAEDNGLESFSCCDEETLLFDGQDQVKLVKDQADYAQPQLSLNRYFVYSPFVITSPDLIPVPNYRPPPLIVRDIQLLHEVYLI